ncbi:unnamed protein product [Durusdinium trenchii]|uniref:Uncharacterized protein n=1 Tax=Durusdinium trenchii TaxID=1381693 RepID=A0ABP0PSI2_9DINO
MAELRLAEEAAQLLSEAVRREAEEAQDLLNRAGALLQRVDEIERQPSFESLLLRGFHALTSYTLQDSRNGEAGGANVLQRAEYLFNAALSFNKSSPRARFGHAVLAASRGDWQQALISFREVLMRAAPQKGAGEVQKRALKNLRFALALCFAGLGRKEKAKKALLGVIAMEEDADALCGLAFLAQQNGQQQQASEYLRRAMQAGPDNLMVYCQAANHAFFCGLEAQKVHGGDPEEWKMASDLLDRAFETKSKQLRAEVHYQRGRLAHARGHFAIAMDEHKRCIDIMPKHLAAVYALAQCYMEQRFYSGTIKLLEKTPKEVQNEPEVMKLLTAAYLATNEHNSKACTMASKLVELAPDLDAWLMKAEAQTRVNPQEAVEAYEHIHQLLQDPKMAEHATLELWNNMGTVLASYGDPSIAKQAYERGIRLVELRLLRSSSQKEIKELEIAKRTLKFNQAWLAETHPNDPELAEAMSLYTSLTEENPWFADAILRLGKQWQNLGMLDQAMATFRMAMDSNCFQAQLHCAEALREAGHFSEAVRWAEKAVATANSKEEHYALVFLGNLYFEASGYDKTLAKDKDGFLLKAMESYVKALENQHDCPSAANGIGMVFARRGKANLAKTIFQSVLQHKSMSENASTYINLAHAYMETNGAIARKREIDDGEVSEEEREDRKAATRKAISLYEMARKLQPDDVSVNLCIANCYNKLKEYDDAAAILSETAHNWPFDIVVKLNQAKNWEDWAKHVVRRYGRGPVFSRVIDELRDALDHLGSAIAAWGFVLTLWNRSDDRERRLLARRAPAYQLEKAMTDIPGRIEYLKMLNRETRALLAERMKDLRQSDYRMQAVDQEREQAEKMQLKRREEENEGAEKERRIEAEDQAIRLMELGRYINLGKNLEAQKDKAAKVKKRKTEEPHSISQETDEKVQKSGEDDSVPEAIEGIFDDDEVVVPREKEKKEKKKKKDKKDKKDKEKEDKKDKKKKKDKKDKKRHREDLDA